MLVIADTSALIAIASCSGLHWLDALFAEIQVPQAVYDEATEQGKPQANALRNYLTGKVLNIEISEFVIAAPKLGKGELEAMALYKQQHADRLLIDDLQARKTANYNNIKIIGSMGILLLAKDKGLVSTVKPHLDVIQQSNIHIGHDLIKKVLILADEVD